MLFLQLLDLILGILNVVYRKRLLKSDRPSLAEIFNRNMQKNISTSQG